MHRFTILFLLLAAGYMSPASAVEAVVNHAEFRKGAAAYTELYWHINTTSLHYKRDSTGKLTARIRTQIRISCDTGIVYKELFYLQTKPFDPAQGDAQNILEQSRADIPTGYIRLELYLSEDGYPEGAFYYKDTLTLPPLAGPAYSSIQLLDTFFAATAPGPFEKANHYHIPRAINFYDEGQQRLHAYAELYHIADLPAGSFPLSQMFYISKRKGERDIAEHSFRDTITVPAEPQRFRRSISLAALPTGNYYLNASLRNAAGVEIATGSTFFQTINKNPVTSVTKPRDTLSSIQQTEGVFLDLSTTFVQKFDIAQLRAILKMMLPGVEPASASAIQGFLERPDELYMRYFIFNHFSNINKADPARAWKEFSDIVREVNRLYKSGSTMGYETDRGVIHLRFGPPVEVIRVPNEAGAVPYEIWRYNPGGKIGGSGLFLFYSPGYMNSDYRLLHSTVPGERQNPSWRGVLYSTGRSSGNANARAEQYFGQ